MQTENGNKFRSNTLEMVGIHILITQLVAFLREVLSNLVVFIQKKRCKLSTRKHHETMAEGNERSREKWGKGPRHFGIIRMNAQRTTFAGNGNVPFIPL